MSAQNLYSIPIEPKVKAERYLLGAMLREPKALPQVIGQLNTIALCHASNDLGRIFLEILKQFRERGTYTVTTIQEKTGADLLGIASTDTEIDLAWAVENWWAEYEKYAQLSAYTHATANVRGGPALDALTMRQNVMKAEAELGLNWSQGKANAAEDFAAWAVEKIEGREKIPNVRPPMLALRHTIPYFEAGDVWTISGDTSMGKTQFAVNLMSYFIDQGEKGIYFSVEMPARAIYKRLLGVRHGINPKADWRGLEQANAAAVSEVCGLDVQIIGDAFNIAEIENICTSAYYQTGLSYVFIDTLDYVKTDDKDDDLRRIAKIYTALVRMAKTMECTIFMLAHLNRENKKRGGSKRPELSDLKGSSTIEQMSAGVTFLYRAEYYEITELADGTSTKGRGEAITKKHRNGEVGTEILSFHPIRGWRDIEGYTPPPPKYEPADFTEAKKDEAEPPF